MTELIIIIFVITSFRYTNYHFQEKEYELSEVFHLEKDPDDGDDWLTGEKVNNKNKYAYTANEDNDDKIKKANKEEQDAIVAIILKEEKLEKDIEELQEATNEIIEKPSNTDELQGELLKILIFLKFMLPIVIR